MYGLNRLAELAQEAKGNSSHVAIVWRKACMLAQQGQGV